MEKEKVIFRKEYDNYMKIWKYLAVFPEERGLFGRICAVPFYFDGYWKAWFEPFCEMDCCYYYKSTKIIHKNDAIIPILLSALKERYEEEYRVMEKIM